MLNCKFQIKPAIFLVFVFLSVILFISNVVAQQGRIIETLDIQGNRRLTDEEILKHIKTCSGERIDEKQLQADLQSLLKLNAFDATDTRILTEEGMRGGVNVIFEVRELPIIVEIKFDGLKYATKEELLSELREHKAEIVVDSPYQPEKMNKAQQIIKNYLVKNRGLTEAKVTSWEEEVTAMKLIISFVVDEIPDDADEDWEKR
jgi:outer membrane protein insertion porin family